MSIIVVILDCSIYVYVWACACMYVPICVCVYNLFIIAEILHMRKYYLRKIIALTYAWWKKKQDFFFKRIQFLWCEWSTTTCFALLCKAVERMIEFYFDDWWSGIRTKYYILCLSRWDKYFLPQIQTAVILVKNAEIHGWLCHGRTSFSYAAFESDWPIVSLQWCDNYQIDLHIYVY